MRTAQIQPIEWVKKKQPAVTLLIQGNDNFKDQCVIQWFLKDAQGIDIDTGWETISGDNYISWNGNNDYPLSFVATQLGLIITG